MGMHLLVGNGHRLKWLPSANFTDRLGLFLTFWKYCRWIISWFTHRFHVFLDEANDLPIGNPFFSSPEGTQLRESWWGALEVGGSCLERVASVKAYTDCHVASSRAMGMVKDSRMGKQCSGWMHHCTSPMFGGGFLACFCMFLWGTQGCAGPLFGWFPCLCWLHETHCWYVG